MPPESPYKSTLRPEDFEPRPGFKISLISVIVYLAGVAVHFFMFGGKDRLMFGGPTAGLVVGGYVVIFLLAVFISFIGFAFAHSRLGATIIFCLAVPALVYADMQVNMLADAKIRPESVAKATPPPTPTPAPAVAGNPTYSETQRDRYVNAASDAFTAARAAKIKAVTDALKALQTVGYVMPVGLTSKEAIAERRKLIETARAANEDYINFVTTQDATYRAELEKTPLVPNDVNVTVSRFQEKNSHTAETLAVRVAERDLLKTTDDIMAALDAMWGRWHLREGKAIFEKRGDSEPYGKLIDRFNATVKAQQDAQAKLTVAQNASTAAAEGGGAPTGADAAAASPAAGTGATPATSAGASATPTATASPAASVPAATVAPVGSPVPAASPKLNAVK